MSGVVQTKNTTLTRSIGLPGAVMLGLGSILGTGVFVSIGIAAGVAGSWVIVATIIAALLATCNALSSAQLAAAHPVSGGTYEYGYRLLTPSVGFGAGWMFLCAKSASAATAAMGFAGYLLSAVGVYDGFVIKTLGFVAVFVMTSLVLTGLKRSSAVNAVIVLVTIAALMTLVCVLMLDTGGFAFTPASLGLDRLPDVGLLEASALMFVAFTGYGRIATMGEEVKEPRQTIPKAIVWTLVVSSLLYVAVTVAVGPLLFAEASKWASPLVQVARMYDMPWLRLLVAMGAITAMLGVLLNLILGLSRVVLAMGRRGDLPKVFGRVSADGKAPVAATIAVGVVIAVIAGLGSIEQAWSLSAFTVLIYYAVTNLAALRLPKEHQLYPRWVSVAGLIGCASLAWWVDVQALVIGGAALLVGFGVRGAVLRSWVDK